MCDIILESDEEEYNLKSIGCDKCPRWFHLKCVEGLAEKDHESLSEVAFDCVVIVQNKNSYTTT